MDSSLFYGIVRRQGEGLPVSFSDLTPWQSVLESICERWGLQESSVRVRYTAPDEWKAKCLLNNDEEFQIMCAIHKLQKQPYVDLEVEVVERTSGTSEAESSFAQQPQFREQEASQPLFFTNVEVYEPISMRCPANCVASVAPAVGMTFRDSQHFKENLVDFAVSRNFDFQYIRNSNDRVTVCCSEEECKWRVHASREGVHGPFRVKTMTSDHSCGGGVGGLSHPKASKKWVSRHVCQKLKDRPSYRPVEMRRDLLRELGVSLSYKQVWRGKEVANETIHGVAVASYDLLLWYAGKVVETNPGSVVTIADEEGRFRRAFFCFAASLHGFKNGCRPLLFVDGTHLLGKYGGTLLAATAKDGNEGMFHVAFAIVDNETDNNWTWFMEKLRDALVGDGDYEEKVTFVSDRSKGLINAISNIFPGSPHAYCLRHLEANFHKALATTSKTVREDCARLLKRIAFALTRSEYDAGVGELREASERAYKWLHEKADQQHWCHYLFRGNRWGEMYSNVAESFNAWIKEARTLPVTKMVDMIRFKMMTMMCNRREESRKWETYLTPAAHQKIEDLVNEARYLIVGRSDGTHFEVTDHQSRAVNLEERTCSCREWQVTCLPCKHACAAILQTDTNVHRYIDCYFTVDAYRTAYERPIYPIPDDDKPTPDRENLRIRPPVTKKKPGRPRRRRIESQGFDIRSLRCSRCSGAGHNRRSCNAVIAD